ncbi:MAG: 50S ribosomal protein L2, partial [bacterium]
MPVKKLNPTTPSQRFRTILDRSDLGKKAPEKSLLVPMRKSGGRNNLGRMTIRSRGGGHRRHYRIVDFKRNKFDMPARVASIEYDPNRSA